MRGGGYVRREGVTILILTVIIITLIPWTILRWIGGDKAVEDFQIRVKMADGDVKTLMLEDYLVGVVAAEMPAEFEMEALKAQSVAARTYAAKKISQRAVNPSDYDVDTTVATQAWISNDQMRDRWGLIGYLRYHKKIEDIVKVTKAQVLVADGQYIDAFFHSSSGRKPTERSEEVWSSSRPYLQNVPSGETDPNRFINHYTFTHTELCKKLGVQVPPSNFRNNDFAILSRTTTGRVRNLVVLGKTYTGGQLRSLLGLASTDMEVIVKSDQIQIKTYGYGHAVGMSQYGANGFAKSGLTYQEILEHFYPGASLLSLTKTKASN